MRTIVFALASVLLIVATAGGLAQAQEFIPLGTVPGYEESFAHGVSDDGSVVAGTAQRPEFPAPFQQAFRWTEATGMVGLGLLPGHIDRSKSGLDGRQPVSADGLTIVGWSQKGEPSRDSEVFRYTVSQGMLGLGATDTQANGVSSDGSVVFGAFTDVFHEPEAFRWTAATGAQRLGFMPGDIWSNATDVSANGTTIVGLGGSTPDGNFTEAEIFTWTEASGIASTGIVVPARTTGRNTAHVSADGMTIAGTSATTFSADRDFEAFRWTAETGVVGLGWLPGATAEDVLLNSQVRDMTPDGQLIVGKSGPNDSDLPFVWTEAGGMEDFTQVLIDDYGLGEQLAGWDLWAIQSVSSNGQFFTGYGPNPDGDLEGWLVRLDAPWGSSVSVPEPSTAVLIPFVLVTLSLRHRRV